MPEYDKKKNVFFSVVATGYEAVYGKSNANIWRPTLDLCRINEFPVDELYLIVLKHWDYLMPDLLRDIASVSPATKVKVLHIENNHVVDFTGQYGYFSKIFSEYIIDAENTKYYINLPPGRGYFLYFCMLSIIYTLNLPLEIFFVFPGGEYSVGNPDPASWLSIARILDISQTPDGVLTRNVTVRNKRFAELLEQVEQVAKVSSAPLLFSGESGTGKSQLARAVYQLKRSAAGLEGHLIEVSCAALRGDSALSALFGHVKGAYTHAVQSRRGLLLQAHKGVLFLDEIGEMDLDSQALLVKALEEKTFLPVGSDVPVYSDFHLICGTNRSLSEEVARGRFRADLFARINLWAFELPPLRERPEDIEANLDFELKRLSTELKRPVAFHPGARKEFLEFAVSPQALWLANFRDFSSAVTRMGTLAAKGIINKNIVLAEKDYLLEMWQKARPDASESCSPCSVNSFSPSAAFVPVFSEAVASVAPAAPSSGFKAEQGASSAFSLLERLASSGCISAKVMDLDYFTKVQLEGVLKVCLESSSLMEAGPRIFGQDKSPRRQSNRLSKYLTGHGINWRQLKLSA